MTITKRRMRFSTVAMLVVMTGVALLLNREARRARAIRTTEDRILEWYGRLSFRPRANMPDLLARVLPQHWAHEIDTLEVSVYSVDPQLHNRKVTLINDSEFDRLLEMGSLDNLSAVHFEGSAVTHGAVSRICRSPALAHCILLDSPILKEDVAELVTAYPKIGFFHCEISD